MEANDDFACENDFDEICSNVPESILIPCHVDFMILRGIRMTNIVWATNK